LSRFDISIEDKRWQQIGSVEDLAELALQAVLKQVPEPVPNGQISLLLCDDATIRELNKDWRGFDKPTNVLSFPSPAAFQNQMLGDLALAFETTAQEAEDEGKLISSHMAHLIVHGVLHLLGYDHLHDTDAEIMERIEILALTSLGIANPYASAD
jgi:probable rRNA maturation factor